MFDFSHTGSSIHLPQCSSHFFRSLGCAEADDVLRKCERVLEVLDQLDEQLFLDWTEGLEEICETHLKEPLLTLDSDTGLFQVNFSPAVSTEATQSPRKIPNTSVRVKRVQFAPEHNIAAAFNTFIIARPPPFNNFLFTVDISAEGSEVSEHAETPEYSQSSSPSVLQTGETVRGG